MGKMSAWT